MVEFSTIHLTVWFAYLGMFPLEFLNFQRIVFRIYFFEAIKTFKRSVGQKVNEGKVNFLPVQ